VRLSGVTRSSETVYNLHSEVDRHDHCHIASPLLVSSTRYMSETRLLSQHFARARTETVLCGKLRDDGGTTAMVLRQL